MGTPREGRPPDAAVERVREYYRAVDANDVDGLLGLFSDDCVYERPGYAPLVGKPALAAFYATDRVIESGRHELTNVVAQQDSVAVEGRFVGQLKNGTAVEVRFADFFRTSGDVFVSRQTYFFEASV